jgi:preprotein translocase subunit SecG
MPMAPVYALDALALLQQASGGGSGSSSGGGGFWALVGQNVVHDQLGY